MACKARREEDLFFAFSLTKTHNAWCAYHSLNGARHKYEHTALHRELGNGGVDLYCDVCKEGLDELPDPLQEETTHEWARHRCQQRLHVWLTGKPGHFDPSGRTQSPAGGPDKRNSNTQKHAIICGSDATKG